MDTIEVKFNGYAYSVRRPATILDASLEAQKKSTAIRGIDIPTLYYLKGINDADYSGACVVEVNNELVNASTTYVSEGMEIYTRTEKVIEARKQALSRILAIHNKSCTFCDRMSDNCELQPLLREYGFTENAPLPEAELEEIDTSSLVLTRDINKCIRCKRCINVCAKVQAVLAITAIGEGLETRIVPASCEGLSASTCVNCGQCVAACPTGALTVKKQIDVVMKALADPDKYVIVQVAPAVGAALGEAFGFGVGTDVKGRIVGALRDLGFDKVFDTAVAADLTIIEESAELMRRIEEGGVLPLITSCCPGWIKYAEEFYPDMLKNISSCKSPHMMFGSLIKDYYAEKLGKDKKDVYVVSIMPCTAKKYEITREELGGVDAVMTTAELALMIRDADLKFEFYSQAEKYDEPLENGSGAGVIFGAAGGVMEAALRTVVEKLTGKPLGKLEFEEVRAAPGIKEASYSIADTTYKVAVACGLANANALLTRIKNGEAEYQFVEIMACPGGCVNGGGQPHQTAMYKCEHNVQRERAQALYSHDDKSRIRRSHEDPAVAELYSKYLAAPGSEKAQQLLHTTYKAR